MTAVIYEPDQRGQAAFEFQWQAVMILSLGFGSVGIKRFLISTMDRAITADLPLEPAISARPLERS